MSQVGSSQGYRERLSSDHTSVRVSALIIRAQAITTPADDPSQSEDVDGPLKNIVVDPAGFLTADQLEKTRR